MIGSKFCDAKLKDIAAECVEQVGVVAKVA